MNTAFTKFWMSISMIVCVLPQVVLYTTNIQLKSHNSYVELNEIIFVL